MQIQFSKSQMALAAVAAIGSATVATAPTVAQAAKVAGKYVAGDFHNHTTCSDGSISMQKLVRKVTDKTGTAWNGVAPDTPWGLDWFVQAGHGNSGGTRNCTLIEDPALGVPTDAELATPVYPFIAGSGPNTTWSQSIGSANVKGDTSSGVGYMWRWQSIQEYQYPLIEYLNAYKNLPLFVGLESIVAGHEHSSMSVITGQMPLSLDTAVLPTAPNAPFAGQIAGRRYTPLGNADALSQWNYCFDAGDTDLSRGNVTNSNVGNNWNCAVPGSLNAANPNWNAAGNKLNNNSGNSGHAKTLEGLKWMAQFHPNASYYVPAHLERAGPFNTAGSNGYNIDHLRDFNNTAPNIGFGMETQPGHGASNSRGEYTIHRNSIGGVNVDSAGGVTFGGTGVYGAAIGGVWDALLGEGRNFWFFASSDWHSRGSFGADDVRSTGDFYPGQYQRNYTMVRNGSDKLRPQSIVDGLRSGNNWAATGQLIDRMAFIACASYPGVLFRSNAMVQGWAVTAAQNNTDVDVSGCSTMGEKLAVRPGADVVVSIVVRDPSGTNFSPYSFKNPSLAQIGISQPLNMPVLDHIDVIRGMVTSTPITPAAADYTANAWPNSYVPVTNPYVSPDITTAPLGARNTTTALLASYSSSNWTALNGDWKVVTFRIPAVQASQYVRLRGTNLPPNVPYETDASGNPLPDLVTNSAAVAKDIPTGTAYAANFFLRIPCLPSLGANSNVPANGVIYTSNQAIANPIDGCPNHLPTVTNQPGVAGFPGGYTGKMMALDVAAWADLWFYSNPIFVEVGGSTPVKLATR